METNGDTAETACKYVTTRPPAAAAAAAVRGSHGSALRSKCMALHAVH